jgi:cytochrome c551
MNLSVPMKYLFQLFLFFSILMYSCSPGGERNVATGASDGMRLNQYMVQGKQLFLAHCSNCHQREGQGIGKLYPPLNPSDFVDNHFEKTICIIKNGMEGEITVNGTVYNMVMPSNKHLSDLEIAEITTYIYNSWGRERGLIGVKQVTEILSGCK